MALTQEQIEFIKEHANTGAKNIAVVLGVKYSTVVNVAHRHRISLKTNDKRGRSMAIHIMQTPETTETVCANKPIIEAIRHEMWIKKEYMGKKVLWSAEWKKQRQRVLKRDGYICAYCGQDATEVDHVIPRARGGGHDLDNLVACCKPCNSRKGAIEEGVFLTQQLTPPVFIDYISPMQSEPMLDSPFKTRPDPSQ
jgi:5-methylcytosine-specific restriction endonuclease McrA